MSYHQAPGGLPVSASEPNAAMYIHGLPQNLPFQAPPPIQCSPQMQEFLAPITGLFLKAVQDGAARTAPRTFLFNLYSQNGYQNDVFLEGLKFAVDYAELLMAVRRVAPEQAVVQATTEAATIMACSMVPRFPQLESMLPQGGAQSVEQWLQHFRGIATELDRFHHSNRGGGGGNWGNQPVQQQGGPFGPQWGGGQPQQQWGPQPPQQPGWGGGPQQQGGWGGGTPARPMGNWAPGHGRGILASKSHSGGGQDMFQQGGGGGHAPQQGSGNSRLGGSLSPRSRAVVEDLDDYAPPNPRRPRRTAPQQEAPVQKASTGFPIWDGENENVLRDGGSVAKEPDMATVSAEQRRWDYHETKSSILIPAHKSPWKRDFTIEMPYRIAFDPEEHMKFHKRDKATGQVQETLISYKEAEGTMDYLKHEMDSSLRQKTRLDGHDEKVIPNWEMVSDMKRLPDLNEEGEEIKVEGQDVDPTKDPVVLPEVLYSHSLEQAKFQHELALIERGVDYRGDELPYEFYYHHITPYMSAASNGKNVQEILSILCLSDSVDAFVTQFGGLHGDIPSDCWHMIHDRATAKVNEALSINIQLEGWEITSIVDDWKDLYDALCEEFGEEQGLGLYNTLSIKLHEDLLASACKVLTGDDLQDYMLSLPDNLIEAHPELDERLVALSEVCSVTHVPWNGDDISLVIDNAGGIVLESKMPALFKAVKGIVKRTEKTGMKFRRRFIMTNDNQKLEIHRGYLGQDYFLLKKA